VEIGNRGGEEREWGERGRTRGGKKEKEREYDEWVPR
jgi:hypothetical protein